MNAELKHQLETAVQSDKPLEEIGALLRRSKEQGVSADEVYHFLEALHAIAPDDADAAPVAQLSRQCRDNLPVRVHLRKMDHAEQVRAFMPGLAGLS